ncbi:MAG: hypothetical protein QXY45_02755 [Candidatus Aenigmatarchaeota archaeon]
MAKKIKNIIFILVLTMLLLFQVKADTANDTATVDVQITGLTEIQINTTGLSFVASPGQNSTPIEVKVENVGSNSVKEIYLDVDTIQKETSNPWNTPATPTAWSATTFLDVKNNTSEGSGSYYYVGSLVWNKTNDDGSGYTLNNSQGATCSECKRAYGRLWFDSVESGDSFYYWQLVNGSDGTCSHASTSFKIQQTRGSRNVDGGTALVTDGGNSTWRTFRLSSGVGSEYCYAVHTSCTKFLIYKYIANTYPTCNNVKYIVENGPLLPGSSIILSFRARIESGHISGSATQGTLSVFASSV